MYENIQFRKQNMTVVNDYFYMFDDNLDALVQKISGGGTSFTYPLDTVLSAQVKNLEHDGINFWTLQDVTGGITIKRWKTSKYTCDLKDEFIYTNDASHTYQSSTFTVEHYHTSLSSTISGGDDVIHLNSYYDTVVSSGVVLTLGPNLQNKYEDVIVNTVSGIDVTLVSGTLYGYDIGDKVNFYTNLWLFNNYDGLNNTGALYKFDAHTGNYIEKFGAAEYKDITACTFVRVNGVFDPDLFYGTFTNADTLLYVKDTNIKYVNIDDRSNYDVMTIDNLKKDESTIITVYDLAVVDKTIYRLQNEANYYETDVSWGALYNYQVSTVRRFVDSITVTAYPSIVPANGYNVIEIKAVVLDQYAEGIVNKPVFFTDTDSVGFITISPVHTDMFFGTGEAVTYYKAGITPNTVTIKGTATQYD